MNCIYRGRGRGGREREKRGERVIGGERGEIGEMEMGERDI